MFWASSQRGRPKPKVKLHAGVHAAHASDTDDNQHDGDADPMNSFHLIDLANQQIRVLRKHCHDDDSEKQMQQITSTIKVVASIAQASPNSSVAYGCAH